MSEGNKTGQVGRACLCKPGEEFGFLVSLMEHIYRILSKGVNDLILFMQRQEGGGKPVRRLL